MNGKCKKPIKGFSGGGIKESKISTGGGKGSPIQTVKSQPVVGKLGHGMTAMGGEVKKAKV